MVYIYSNRIGYCELANLYYALEAGGIVEMVSGRGVNDDEITTLKGARNYTRNNDGDLERWLIITDKYLGR